MDLTVKDKPRILVFKGAFMIKRALVDIGTNSVRMIILKEDDTDCIYALKRMQTTRIGQGVDQSRNISEEGMARTLEALKVYAEIAEEENVDSIYAIATSAVRDAKNRDVFLDAVKKEVGIEVAMISGEEEARLGFLGVTKGLETSGIVHKDDYILVVDIGGGSTEFIVGKNGEIEYSASLDIGAVRMSDKFVDSDPMSLTDQDKMADYIRLEVKKVISIIREYNIEVVIGIGGTITTAGSIALEMEEYVRTRIHNYFVPLEDIHQINRELLKKTVEERKSTKGLQPARADIIPAGFMILQLILLSLEKDGVVISEYDNLEGMFFDGK